MMSPEWALMAFATREEAPIGSEIKVFSQIALDRARLIVSGSCGISREVDKGQTREIWRLYAKAVSGEE